MTPLSGSWLGFDLNNDRRDQSVAKDANLLLNASPRINIALTLQDIDMEEARLETQDILRSKFTGVSNPSLKYQMIFRFINYAG